ncbi:MAG: hypothetical protein WBV45_08185 [Lutimonas sp.]
MKNALFLIAMVVFCSSGMAQESLSIEQLRQSFQEISSKEDIERIMNMSVDPKDPDARIAKAYQATSETMMAEYVFSPIKKLKYFNKGKASLENLIKERKSAENVYLRLMIQLNIPKFLNYYKNIDEDINYVKTELPSAKIDGDYKCTMIRNLVTLAGEDELKEDLLGIELTCKNEKL